jgi:hypothetical protein
MDGFWGWFGASVFGSFVTALLWTAIATYVNRDEN